MLIIDAIESQLSAIKGAPVEVRIPSSVGNKFMCTCPNPEHPDHHPSCVGDLISGQYKCLGCGFSGTLSF